ncbi:MAG: hypothetical protein U5K43_15610 [Halofilum sp. (in: g-proteobacteria)]|nr:hypothetical protein [Halofilum sp. (in: g-proteobacteria)]
MRDGGRFLWALHMARLAHGCRQLLLPAPARDTLARRDARRLRGDDTARHVCA